MQIPNYKTEAQPIKHAAGSIVIDGNHVADTMRCVHCSAHWQVIRGSGRRRGYCMICKGATCGSPPCGICIPLEARLEGWEAKKSLKQVLKDLETRPKHFL